MRSESSKLVKQWFEYFFTYDRETSRVAWGRPFAILKICRRHTLMTFKLEKITSLLVDVNLLSHKFALPHMKCRISCILARKRQRVASKARSSTFVYALTSSRSSCSNLNSNYYCDDAVLNGVTCLLGHPYS
jgi:hypothetical protein